MFGALTVLDVVFVLLFFAVTGVLFLFGWRVTRGEPLFYDTWDNYDDENCDRKPGHDEI